MRRSLGAAFAQGGARYERLRPGFPQAVVPWSLGDTPRRVADVGAGTGKLTRALIDAGHDVVAVDPSADMLAQLRGTLPGVPTLLGTGERTGLPGAPRPAGEPPRARSDLTPTAPPRVLPGEEGSSAFAPVDAMVYAQAWHWVDPVAGSAEAARVLPSGGVLGLIWNVMDVDVPWVAALNDAIHSAASGPVADRWYTADEVEPPLVLDARTAIPFGVEMTVGDLAGLVMTRSYYLAMDETGRAELADRVRATVHATFGDDDDRIVELPYVTRAFRFVRA